MEPDLNNLSGWEVAPFEVSSDRGLPKKQNKYYAKKVKCVNGTIFDSRLEYRHWMQLLLLYRAGKITELKRQVRYVFVVNGVKVGSYRPDFSYVEGGKLTVVDTKSSYIMKHDKSFPLRKLLMKALYGVDVQVVS